MRHLKTVLFVGTSFYLTICFASEVTGGRTRDVRSTAPNGPARSVSPENVCSPGVTVVGVTEHAGADLENTTCEMPLDANFAQMLREDAPRCAKEAALKIYGKVPVSIQFYQMGAYNVRKINTPANRGVKDSDKTTSPWSKHSTGQAMDFAGVGLDFGDDSRMTKVEFTSKTNNQPYYDAFRDCWDKTARTTRSGKSCKTCSIGHPHTHPFSNVLHNDHMHFSMDCRPPKLQGVAGC